MTDLPHATDVFVADVHWRPAASSDEAAAHPFARFLAELARHGARQGRPPVLHILGDLFDFWYERGGVPQRLYQPYLEQLRASVHAGIRIEVLYGNRDFTYKSLLQRECGVRVVGDRSALRRGDKRLLLQHGDLFCTRDQRYQTYRRVIRSLPGRILTTLIPPRTALRTARRMQAVSRAENARKRQASMGIVDEAVAAEHARGFDWVVCGHIHQASRRRVTGAPEGTELIVLGPWSPATGGTFAALSDGRITLHAWPASDAG